MADLTNNTFVGYGQGAGLNQTGTTPKPDAYYDKMLLKMLRQMEFKYAKYANEKMLPKNFGDTINWRRFNKLEVTKTPLQEGITPDGAGVSGTSITATIAQYGNVMYFTDVVDLLQLDKVRQEYTVELGYQAKETLDEIVRDVLVAEGSAYFAGNAASVAAIDTAEGTTAGSGVVKIDDFRKIMLSMKRQFIGGNRKAGGKYVALIAPEIMFALFDDSRVQDFMSFGQTNSMFGDGQVVDMFGIRFEEVLNTPLVEGTNAVIYDSIVIGEEAYAVTKLEGAGLQVITKGLGSAGVEDALNQRQSIGWKITGFGAKVLRPEAVVNYWSTAMYGADQDEEVPHAYDEDAYTTFKATPFTVSFVNTAGTDLGSIGGILPGMTIAQVVTLFNADGDNTDVTGTVFTFNGKTMANTAVFGDNIGFDASYDDLVAADITIQVTQ